MRGLERMAVLEASAGTRRRATFAILSAVLISALPGYAPAQAPDELTRMFEWWNGAIRTPGAFTAEAFGRYFDPQASMIINGHLSAHGLQDLASHFQHIQASGVAVEVELPFKEEFRSGDRIYTYHVISSRLKGRVGCDIAAGHAVIKAGKILSLTLVEQAIDYQKPPVDPQCWRR